MSTKYLTLIGILAFILLLGGCGCNNYNSLVTNDLEVQKVWANVETQYQRRTDLYKSEIKVIQGSANFEKSTLIGVVQARASATQIKVDINNPETLAKYQAAQGQLQSAFGKLMAIAESYPDLKSTKAFTDFQKDISGTENRINIARMDYNKAVNDYNLKVRMFPNNIWASIFHFSVKAFYQADAGSEKAPDTTIDIK